MYFLSCNHDSNATACTRKAGISNAAAAGGAQSVLLHLTRKGGRGGGKDITRSVATKALLLVQRYYCSVPCCAVCRAALRAAQPSVVGIASRIPAPSMMCQ